MRLAIGQPAIPFTIQDGYQHKVSLSDYQGHPVLLSFYRFASCPLCNLRLWYLIQQHERLYDQGLRVIAIFDSSPERIIEHTSKIRAPFPLVADPEKQLYQRYGIGTSWVGLWYAILIRRRYEYWRAHRLHLVYGERDGTPDLLPADFLINPDQTIDTAHYGKDTGDFLSFHAIERFVKRTNNANTVLARSQRIASE